MLSTIELLCHVLEPSDVLQPSEVPVLWCAGSILILGPRSKVEFGRSRSNGVGISI